MIALPHFLRSVSDCYRPQPDYTVSEWSDRKVYLDRQMTPHPGNYRTLDTPWNKRVMDLDRSRFVREVIVRKSSRAGLTEAVFNAIRFRAAHPQVGGHSCFVAQKMTKAKNMMRRRVHASLKRCARSQVTGDRDDMAMAVVRLKHMEIHAEGSGSEGAFTEIFYHLLFLDEYDGHEQAGEEANADQARSRIRDVDGATLYIGGKCKLVGGPLDLEYRTGTQERYMVPCPRCGDRIELCEPGLRYNHLRDEDGFVSKADVLRGTYYECPACGGRIDEADKRDMVEAALEFDDDGWVPAPADRKAAEETPDLHFNPKLPCREGGRKYRMATPERVSMMISDFYSLQADMTWGHLAWLIIEAEDKPEKRKALVIDHFGTGYDDSDIDVEITDSDIAACRGWWRRRPRMKEDPLHVAPLPFTPMLFAAFADVQKHTIKWAKEIFAYDGTRCVVDYGECLGFAALEEILDLQHPIVGTDDYAAHEHGLGLIDSRYEMDEVFEFCLSGDYRLHPAMGIKNVDSVGFAERKKKPFKDTYVWLYKFNNHAVLRRWLIERIGKRRGPLFHIPKDAGGDFMAELCAVQLVKGKDPLGFEKEQFEKVGEKKDWGDCCKMGDVFWHLVESNGEVEERRAEIDEVELENPGHRDKYNLGSPLKNPH